MKKKKQKQQHLRGSVLVFSMLVLTMLLSIAISGAVVVIADKRASLSTEKSALSFQIADGAAENILKRIYKDTDPTLDALAGSLYANAGNSPSCLNGVISGVLPSSFGTYKVAFFKNDDTSVGCTNASWRSLVVHMVITGTYANTTRAIDVGIEP